MVIRDENGKATAVSVKYHGIDFYISKDMLTGENKNWNPKSSAWIEILNLAKIDPEAREAIDEMLQDIMGQ